MLLCMGLFSIFWLRAATASALPLFCPMTIGRSAADSSGSVEELKRVNRRRSLADLEVELRRPHLARLTRFGNDLAALDRVAALHHQFTRMGICGDVTVGVPNQNQIAIAFEFVSGIGHDAVLRRLYGRTLGYRQIDAVIGL